MQTLLNKFINLFKWPVAIYMLILLPAIFASVDSFSFVNYNFMLFGGGIIGYLLLRIASDSSARVSMQTIVHELTHSFFALLTFHKIKKISLAQDNSGEMAFEGEGNWLIVIAPYFFPLLVFFFMIFEYVWLLFLPYNFILTLAFGYLTGMHIDTVVSQIHEKQTDLPKVSYLFCALFLPGANLATIGSILAYNSRNLEGIVLYWELINKLTLQYINNLLQMIY